MPLTRSRHKVGRGYLGPLPSEVWEVVAVAWEAGIAVSSNYAREHSAVVALAASLGWISNVALDGKTYLRHWNVTAEGVTALNHRELH
jgi:hypothetical protein